MNDPLRDGTIPSPLGVRGLAFLGAVCAEYWLGAAVLGVDNYAGAWSLLGYGLFGACGLALLGWVVVPLGRRLRSRFASSGGRGVFVGAFALALSVCLGLSRTLQVDPAGIGTWTPPGLASAATVYTPFGAWPSWGLTVPGLGITGAIDPVTLLIFVLLSSLSAGVVTLRRAPPAAACAPAAASGVPGPPARGVVAVAWAPLGLLSTCPACTPAYGSLLGFVAPGAASVGYSGLALAPWVGGTGLLDLASFGIVLLLLHRATRLPGKGTGGTESVPDEVP